MRKFRQKTCSSRNRNISIGCSPADKVWSRYRVGHNNWVIIIEKRPTAAATVQALALLCNTHTWNIWMQFCSTDSALTINRQEIVRNVYNCSWRLNYYSTQSTHTQWDKKKAYRVARARSHLPGCAYHITKSTNPLKILQQLSRNAGCWLENAGYKADSAVLPFRTCIPRLDATCTSEMQPITTISLIISQLYVGTLSQSLSRLPAWAKGNILP